MGGKSTYRVDLKGKDKTGVAFASVDKRIKMLEGSMAGLTAMMAPLAAAAVSIGLVSLGKEALDTADRIQKLSIQLGIGAEFLSEITHASGLSGVSFEATAMALRKMERSIEDGSDGLSTLVRVFDKSNVSISDLQKMSPDKAFLEIAEAINKLPTPFMKTQAAMAIFGRAGADLIPMMDGGKKGILGLLDASKRLGYSFGDDMVQKAADANDALQELDTASKALIITLTLGLAPVITEIATALATAIPNLAKGLVRGFKEAAAAVLRFDMIMLNADITADKLAGKLPFVDTTESLDFKVKKLAGISQQYGEIMKELYAPELVDKKGSPKTLDAGDIIEPLVAAASVIRTKVTPAIDESASSINKMNDAYMEMIGAFTSGEVDEIMADVDDQLKSILPTIDEVTTEIEDSNERIKDALEGGVRGFGYAITDMMTGVSTAAEAMERAALNALSNILDAFIQTQLDTFLASFASNTGGQVASGDPGFIGPIQGGSKSMPPSASVSTSGGAAAYPIVNLNIYALEGAGATAAIVKHKDVIVGIVNEAYNKVGLRGPQR